jgi:hypothetical protein
MMYARVIVVALVALASGGSLRADEVFLRNGSSIVGRAAVSGDEVSIAVGGGVIRVRASEVERVDRAPLDEELYAARAAATDMADPDAVRALAQYARSLGLREQAEQLEHMAIDVELEKRVAALDPNDGAGYRAVAAWAHEHGVGVKVQRWLYERALAINPEDGLAHLGLERLDGEERAAAIAAAREKVEKARRDHDALERELAQAREDAARARADAARERDARIAAEAQARGNGVDGYPPGVVVPIGGIGVPYHRHVVFVPAFRPPPPPPRGR